MSCSRTSMAPVDVRRVPNKSGMVFSLDGPRFRSWAQNRFIVVEWIQFKKQLKLCFRPAFRLSRKYISVWRAKKISCFCLTKKWFGIFCPRIPTVSEDPSTTTTTTATTSWIEDASLPIQLRFERTFQRCPLSVRAISWRIDADRDRVGISRLHRQMLVSGFVQDLEQHQDVCGTFQICQRCGRTRAHREVSHSKLVSVQIANDT